MKRAARCLATALVALPALAGSAHAATAADTIRILNKQRAANGIPAGIVEMPTWSTDCAQHDHYMAVNNHQLTHVEDPGNPAYTQGGAYAGVNAVLAQNLSWDSGNPYEDAPLHLDQLLAPRLSQLGSADAEGFTCTTTFPGWVRVDPPALTVYTYPGNGAPIYASEIAREQPWTPGQLAGIQSGSRTGPYLIVLVDAAGQSPYNNPATLSNATLTGPNGAASVVTVDGTTGVPGGQASLSSYISPGGFIVPVKPLFAGVTYRAHVVVGFAGRQIPYDWSFTTIGADPRSVLRARGGKLSFSSSSPQPVTVTFTRAGGRHARGVTIAPGRSVRITLAPGSWQACGHQPGTSRFAPFDGCVAIIVTGTPTLRLGPARAAGSTVRFPLRFSSVLRGHSATLSVTPLTVRCNHGSCTLVAGRPVISTIVVRAKSLPFPLPARRRGIAISVDTAAFQLADAPWAAAHATARFVRR